MPSTSQPLNIRCASCGAPAKFDITRQTYTCAYCGAETGIAESLAQRRGFQKLHREKMADAVRDYPLVSTTCTGCGAEVVFPENEALTQCAFCGRALARREYLDVERFPEILIPFRITAQEARKNLSAWCAENPKKRESREIQKHIDKLQGFYLPYECVKGPVDCTVQRSDGRRKCHCRGFLDGSFVNTSGKLNNLLLNSMEPYDLDEVREFDFAYLAGHRVRMQDIDNEQTEKRVAEEIASDYEPYLAKTMETRALKVTPSTDALWQLSAVLPAYYLRAGDTIAAVNGQTGKVAVWEAKDRFLLPWQWKPVLGHFC